MKKVVTRFAPSPTGFLHLGGYRTAVFSYLYAKQHNGEFILRIEDTDKERSTKEFEDNILETMAWLELPYQHFYRQSERVERHRYALESMISSGHAYISKEEAKDGSGVIKDIVRFKNPGGVVTFTDIIRGEVATDVTDLGDFVLAKNLNEPLFHLAVVVDDAEMGVTHVIRGEDHIANTPRQILIQRALGFETPIYAHLPLVLAPDRTKLSKRNGGEAVTNYRDKGYTREAIFNMIALTGWHPEGDVEVLTRDEIEKEFDLARVQKGGAIFNSDKLDFLNREHMKKESVKDQSSEIYRYLPEEIKKSKTFSMHYLERITPAILERINYYGEVHQLGKDGVLNFYFFTPTVDPALLISPKTKMGPDANILIKEYLNGLADILETLPVADWTVGEIKNSIWEYSEVKGRGDVLWAMRTALSGMAKSPDPFEIAHFIGKEETLKRLRAQ